MGLLSPVIEKQNKTITEVSYLECGSGDWRDGKPDSLHPCGAPLIGDRARDGAACREPYSGAISPRVSAEKAGAFSSG